MNTDFRMSIMVLESRKIQKLMRRKGDTGFRNIVKLWATTAANQPSGSFDGFDNEDIMAFAGTSDEEFVPLLVECGLLDFDDGVYKIHNWSKHNPWAVDAEKRSETARKAAKARWSGSKNK